MNEAMNYRPAPAMVVALLALFVAFVAPAVGKHKSPGVVHAVPPKNSVGAAQIKPNGVGASEIKTNAVAGKDVAKDGITPGALAPGSVVGTPLANGVVTSTKLADGSVATGKLADDSISGVKLKTDAVGPTQIAPGAVLQSKIGGGAVGTPQLSNTIPSASAFKDTATTWTNNGYTAMHYPSEMFDTANLHSASPDYRMTAPVAGIYQATAVATWANDGCGGTRSLEFDGRRADGSTAFLPSPFISSTVPANAGPTTSQTLTGMIQLAAGESLEIWGGAGGMPCGTTETLGTPAASLTMTYMNPGP